MQAWSFTPIRDMVFYTLGVLPAEPYSNKARIAPQLGKLDWAKGNVPAPHGLISIETNTEIILIDSPIPAVLDLKGQPALKLPPGKYETSTLEEIKYKV